MVGSTPPGPAQNTVSPNLGKRPGPWPPKPTEAAPSKATGSWAQRTGFKPDAADLETGNAANAANALPKPPGFTSRTRPKEAETLPVKATPRNEDTNSKPINVNGYGTDVVITPKKPAVSDRIRKFLVVRPEPQSSDDDSDLVNGDDDLIVKDSQMSYELRENPGLVPLALYGLQHYLSIVGSIILIPLVIVPAMGGRSEDTAHVVSTVLLVTGISTLLHTFFGSRLPLIQGPSFVYLAPALAIINSTELTSISTDRFKQTMRELQGAIIIASSFQAILGYSGLMSLFIRLLSPIVITPTIAAVGLAFYTYGFTVVGSCVEIGIPQFIVVVIFALHLRKVSVFGHHIFQVYAIPMGLTIVWAYAFLLTTSGAYNYHGCSVDIPTSNVVSEKCRKHLFTMMHCRTNISAVLKTVSWLRIPYPFQWGMPTFHWNSAGIMIVASIIASVDSVESYYSSSLLVASRTPTPGVVSRAIGLEGLTSILAGMWGIGTGATTLSENVHTLAVTRMGSRRAIEFGACVLILMSFVGKVGAFIASIPQVIVAALLCIMWAMLTAVAMSSLKRTNTGSSRNAMIIGLSLFFSLSVPVYFQQYATVSKVATVESYFQPYTVGSNGPVRTGIKELDFFLNTILSMNMVIAFIAAILLDNTVPGSKEERGMYIWSKQKVARREPAVVKDYSLPPYTAKLCRWVRWVGL